APGNDALLPRDYWRDSNGYVLTTDIGKNGPYVVTVINYPVLAAALDEFNDKVLRFEAMVGAPSRWCELDVSMAMQPAQAATALAQNGIFIHPSNHKHARDFLVSWVGHLQTIKKYVNQSAYGWLDGNKAFA